MVPFKLKNVWCSFITLKKWYSKILFRVVAFEQTPFWWSLMTLCSMATFNVLKLICKDIAILFYIFLYCLHFSPALKNYCVFPHFHMLPERVLMYSLYSESTLIPPHLALTSFSYYMEHINHTFKYNQTWLVWYHKVMIHITYKKFLVVSWQQVTPNH